LHAFYGEFLGVRIVRKHMGWYLQYLPAPGNWRREFNALASPAEQLIFTDRIFNSINDKDLAA
jgi:tRNA-dihydrouridine synthase B